MAPHCLKPTTQPHLLIQEEKREMKAMATSGDFLPPLVMVVVQFLYAGLNITSKLAMEFGMNPLVLVAYRQMFATVAIAPCAYWIERYMYLRIYFTSFEFNSWPWKELKFCC